MTAYEITVDGVRYNVVFHTSTPERAECAITRPDDAAAPEVGRIAWSSPETFKSLPAGESKSAMDKNAAALDRLLRGEIVFPVDEGRAIVGCATCGAVVHVGISDKIVLWKCTGVVRHEQTYPRASRLLARQT